MGKPRKKFSATESGGNGGGGRGGGRGGDEDIHAAARSGDLHGVQSICGSNPLAVNLRDKHSRTPLHLAAWSGQTEVVNYLCKNKADAGAAAMDDMGAIHFAAQKGHTEVVKALVSSGISIKACNRKGLNPLHYAVQGDHKELIKYLMRKGASLTTKTKAGKTPLDLAKSDEVRTYLLELEESAKKEKAENVTEKVEEDSTGQNVIEKNEDDSSPKQSLEDKPIGPPEREAVTKQEEGKEQDNEDDDSSPKQSLEDKPIGPPEREAVTKQEEGKEQDNEDGKVKRKSEEAEIQRKSSVPKKAKIALNHLVAADYDTQEENS